MANTQIVNLKEERNTPASRRREQKENFLSHLQVSNIHKSFVTNIIKLLIQTSFFRRI